MKQIKSPQNISGTRLLLVAGVFAILGTIALLRTQAAINHTQFEAESGTLSGTTKTQSTAEASNGSYVTLNSSDSQPNPSTCSTEEAVACTEGNSSGTYFKETFNASPSAPLSVMNRMDLLPRWFAQPAMQGTMGWMFKSLPMQGQHSAMCGPAPATHHVEEFADTVFMCKDHIMTTMSPPDGGTSAGLVALKPNHMVDLSKGEAVISVDVSTSSPSAGDWWEIWITPWNDQLVSPTDHWLHHAGPPKNSIQLMVFDCPARFAICGGDHKNWVPQVYRDYNMQLTQFIGDGTIAFSGIDAQRNDFRSKVPVSDTRRDPYIVRITKNHVKLLVKSPNTNNQESLVYEFDIPGGFPANEAVVQFLQSSYEPRRDRKLGCPGDPCPENTVPATWHWDNVIINPAIPYTLIGTKEFQLADTFTGNKVTFNEPAPANARMLFNGQSLGNIFDVSFDNGATWANATTVRPPNGQAAGSGFPGSADMDLLTYTVNVPSGATTAVFRGRNMGCGRNCGPVIDPYGVWMAQNFHLIAR